jgi:hypothetical protein
MSHSLPPSSCQLYNLSLLTHLFTHSHLCSPLGCLALFMSPCDTTRNKTRYQMSEMYKKCCWVDIEKAKWGRFSISLTRCQRCCCWVYRDVVHTLLRLLLPVQQSPIYVCYIYVAFRKTCVDIWKGVWIFLCCFLSISYFDYFVWASRVMCFWYLLIIRKRVDEISTLLQSTSTATATKKSRFDMWRRVGDANTREIGHADIIKWNSRRISVGIKINCFDTCYIQCDVIDFSTHSTFYVICDRRTNDFLLLFVVRSYLTWQRNQSNSGFIDELIHKLFILYEM